MGKVTIIAGGIKTESRLTGLTQLAANELVTNGLEVNIIEVHKINAEALVTADFAHSDIQLANSEIESSSGVIIATPIFKATLFRSVKSLFGPFATQSFERESRFATWAWWVKWTFARTAIRT